MKSKFYYYLMIIYQISIDSLNFYSSLLFSLILSLPLPKSIEICFAISALIWKNKKIKFAYPTLNLLIFKFLDNVNKSTHILETSLRSQKNRSVIRMQTIVTHHVNLSYKQYNTTSYFDFRIKVNANLHILECKIYPIVVYEYAIFA